MSRAESESVSLDISRDGISDATGQDLEAGHPVGYSVILSQLQTVTKVRVPCHCTH